MCMLEVVTCEKCRSSHFQSERGVKSLKTGGTGLKNFRTGGLPISGGLLLGGEVSHAMEEVFPVGRI